MERSSTALAYDWPFHHRVALIPRVFLFPLLDGVSLSRVHNSKDGLNECGPRLSKDLLLAHGRPGYPLLCCASHFVSINYPRKRRLTLPHFHTERNLISLQAAGQ